MFLVFRETLLPHFTVFYFAYFFTASSSPLDPIVYGLLGLPARLHASYFVEQYSAN